MHAKPSRPFSSTVPFTAALLGAAAAGALLLHAPGASAQSTEPGLEAGGLAPPPAPAAEPTPEPPTPEQQMAESDQEDSERGLEFFWLTGEIGMQHLGLQTFKANDLVDAEVVKTTQTGLAYGGALGIRLVFLTAGARFRLANFSGWQFWTLDAEAGLHIPLGMLEPYFTFGLGYASIGSFNAANIAGSGVDGIDITGFNARAGFGIDYYLSETFSLGALLNGDVMFLQRPKLSVQAGGDPAAAEIYAKDGSSIGGGFSLTAVAGLHF
jgi:hypothetical protein